MVARERMRWSEYFDSHFYPQFPRKVAKIEARRAWNEMTPADSSKSREDCNKILERLEWFMETQWPGRDQQHLPHPATWLRAEIEDFQLSAPLSAARLRSGARTRAGACSAVLPWPSGSTGKASGDG